MKINKITKSLSIMLTLCMLFSLAPALGTTAMATGSSTVLSESFDAGTLPAGWTLQSSGNTSFFIAQNFGNASSAAAHGGAGYSAFCRGVAYSYNTSYLITPAINLPDAVTIDVSFYYINPVWDSDANQPSVCWSTSAEGPWTLLWSSTTDESGAYTAPGSTNKTAAKNAAVENWTQVEVDLSGLSGTIYLAFGSCDGYVYGVGYDDIAVTAETTLINYNVWIGGTRVTNANRKNILNSTGKPAAAYTPTDGSSPARLALNNAAITAVSENGATYGIYSTEDLNIEVTGTNTVTASGDTGTTSGIAVLDAEVARACTFTGSGTLTVTSSDTKAEKTGDLCTGIKSGSLTVQSDLTLSFAAGDSGTSYGISTDSLTINEGRVTAQGMTSAVSTAPVLTGYARAYAVTASTSYDGAAPAASYNEAAIGTYKYLLIEPRMLTVTLDPNGGSVAPTTLSVLAGTAYGALPTPTRSGYAFYGWWTALTDGTQVTAETIITASAAHTLYARWRELITVTLDPNGGTYDGFGNQTASLDDSNIVTDPGAGAGGADISVVEGGGISFGHGANIALSPDHSYYVIADDFTLQSKTYVSEMEFYAYQTGSTTASTITGIYLMIYDGDPSLDSSKLIWGDRTSNRLKSTEWTGIYRVVGDTPGNTDRPVMNVVADTEGLTLDAGTYWFVFGLTGSLQNGPWVPPVCIQGDQTAAGNMKQNTEHGWISVTDNNTQAAAPYIIRYKGDGFAVRFGDAYGALPTPTRSGYAFDGWWTAVDGGEKITAETIMNSTSDQTLYAHWTYTGTGSITMYKLFFSTNGGSAIAPVYNTEGAKVELAAYAPTRGGYAFAGWYADAALTVPVTSVVLRNDTTVYAGWTWINPFADVNSSDWFYDSVAYVHQNGLFAGTSKTTFSPSASMTRGMLWTVMARLAGTETDSSSNVSYYDAARTWAMEKGLTDGTNPDAPVTREQLVTTLYRCAQLMGCDTTQGGMAVREFADYESISAYAGEAMAWAVNADLIQGSGNRLMPQDTATRAQVAAILQRFCEKIVK